MIMYLNTISKVHTHRFVFKNNKMIIKYNKNTFKRVVSNLKYKKHYDYNGYILS